MGATPGPSRSAILPPSRHLRHICRTCDSAIIGDNRSGFRHFSEQKKKLGSGVSPDIGDEKVNYEAGFGHFIASLITLCYALTAVAASTHL
jgi:hypothetical protein